MGLRGELDHSILHCHDIRIWTEANNSDDFGSIARAAKALLVPESFFFLLLELLRTIEPLHLTRRSG
jgi:hypothetical protein